MDRKRTIGADSTFLEKSLEDVFSKLEEVGIEKTTAKIATVAATASINTLHLTEQLIVKLMEKFDESKTTTR